MSRRGSSGSSSTTPRAHRADASGSGTPCSTASQAHELEGVQCVEHRLLLRHQPDAAHHREVAAGIAAEHPHLSPGRGGEPAQHSQHRALAGAVGPEQRGDPGPDGERHLRHGHDVAEPLRHAVDGDHGVDGGRPGRLESRGRCRRRRRQRGGGRRVSRVIGRPAGADSANGPEGSRRWSTPPTPPTPQRSTPGTC